MTDVPHPRVSGWPGERSWSAPDAPPSGFVIWTATDAGAPFAIVHHREVMADDGALVQDYNYLVYRFGDPADPIVARHYLGDREVSVILTRGGTLAQARAAFPPAILAWLQQRFAAVTVLTDAGYETVWAEGEG